jgi:phage I-like protein
MDQHSGYLVDCAGIQLDEAGNTSWIQVFPLGHWDHPLYGPIDVDTERAKRFADNVNSNVRGIDLAIDYDHVTEGPAAGWYREAQVRDDGVWAKVEWTPKALQHLQEKEYRYFSPDFVDEWQHPSTGQKYQDVLFGGGLTNRPHLKGILPINLSEVIDRAPQPPKPPEGGKMNEALRKLLAEKLGLPETATEADIQTEMDKKKSWQFSETISSPPAPPANPNADLIKKLGEVSPELGTLVQGMQQQLAEQSVQLHASRIEGAVAKLEAKAREKGHTLTPADRQQLTEALVKVPVQLAEFTTTFAETLLDAKLVKLGETAGAGSHNSGGNGGNGKTATERFGESIKSLMEADKNMVLREAMSKAAAKDPALYAEYTQENSRVANGEVN